MNIFLSYLISNIKQYYFEYSVIAILSARIYKITIGI